MSSILERKLIVVTGKGGVGKTTLSAAVGLLAARRGLRTIVVELSGVGSDGAAAGRLATLLGHAEAPAHGVEVELDERLWGLSIDRDRVLAEWLRALGGRVPARVLTSSSSFQYLIAAAPGAREMLSMVKLWELAQDRRPDERRTQRDGGQPASATGGYDLVVLDAPATGHALALLRSPQMFSAIARVGPVARQARQVRELLEDPAHSAYLGIAQATEMSSTETLELREDMRRELGRDLDAIVINGTLPRRFEGVELRQIADLDGKPGSGRDGQGAGERRNGKQTNALAVKHSARRAALAVHERARAQHGQIARLRRQEVPVLTIPLIFQAELDLPALQRIVDLLERRL